MGLPCDGSCRCSSPTWRGWRLWPWAPRSSLRTLEPFQRRRSGGGWRSASASAGVLGGTASLDAVASGERRKGRAFEGRASWDQSQRASSPEYISRGGHTNSKPETPSVRTSNPSSGVSPSQPGTPDAPLQAHLPSACLSGRRYHRHLSVCTAQALARSPSPRHKQAPTLWVHPLFNYMTDALPFALAHRPSESSSATTGLSNRVLLPCVPSDAVPSPSV